MDFLNSDFFENRRELRKNRTFSEKNVQKSKFLHGYSIFFIDFFLCIYSIRAIQRTYSRLLKVNSAPAGTKTVSEPLKSANGPDFYKMVFMCKNDHSAVIFMIITIT